MDGGTEKEIKAKEKFRRSGETFLSASGKKTLDFEFLELPSFLKPLQTPLIQPPPKMFAVPGWSVSSSSLKTQTLGSSNPAANGATPATDGNGAAPKATSVNAAVAESRKLKM